MRPLSQTKRKTKLLKHALALCLFLQSVSTFLLATWIAGCAGTGGGSVAPPPPPAIQVSVSPSSGTVLLGATMTQQWPSGSRNPLEHFRRSLPEFLRQRGQQWQLHRSSNIAKSGERHRDRDQRGGFFQAQQRQHHCDQQFSAAIGCGS
jgi:hypothetical protein